MENPHFTTFEGREGADSLEVMHNIKIVMLPELKEMHVETLGPYNAAGLEELGEVGTIGGAGQQIAYFVPLRPTDAEPEGGVNYVELPIARGTEKIEFGTYVVPDYSQSVLGQIHTDLSNSNAS